MAEGAVARPAQKPSNAASVVTVVDLESLGLEASRAVPALAIEEPIEILGRQVIARKHDLPGALRVPSTLVFASIGPIAVAVLAPPFLPVAGIAQVLRQYRLVGMTEGSATWPCFVLLRMLGLPPALVARSTHPARPVWTVRVTRGLWPLSRHNCSLSTSQHTFNCNHSPAPRPTCTAIRGGARWPMIR